MTQYIFLKNVRVQNVNATSGLTYGFPSITNFLGFAHALSRVMVVENGVSLNGVVVVSHSVNIQCYETEGWGDRCFALTRNPINRNGGTDPIIEEGRLAMCVSLFIEISGDVPQDKMGQLALMSTIEEKALFMRLGGGQIIDIESCEFIEDVDAQHSAVRSLRSGVVLLDRSDYLDKHYSKMLEKDLGASQFDAWTDFVKLKFESSAIPSVDENSKDVKSVPLGKWTRIPKPNPGYLVPILVGYKAVADIANAGSVPGVRDQVTPVAFVEPVHSVGEWKNIHRLKHLDLAVWRYTYEPGWYIAKAINKPSDNIVEPDQETLI
jgi:CRISPR-associated protein Csy2